MASNLGSNLYQFAFGISAGLAAMACGAWLSWPSSVIPFFKDPTQNFTMTSTQISTMVSLMDLGNVLSPVPTGYLMNAIGRKFTLVISGVLCALANCAVLAFHDVGMIYFARLLAGISKGMTYAIVPIYLAEMANTKIRGALSTMFVGFINLGMVYDYIIGPNVSYQGLNIANFILPILFLLTITLFPESPYYLAMIGKEDAARKALSKVKCKTGSELKEDFSQMANKVESDMKNKARFIDLVTSATNRRALLIVLLLSFFQRSSGSSPIIAYSSTTLPVQGGGLSRDTYMIMFSILLVIANFVATPLVDKLGRKPLLLISSWTTAFVTGVVSLFYYAQWNSYDVTNFQWVPYFGVLGYAITYSIGIGFIPSTLVGELFPTNVKSYAGSVSAIVLSSVSFILNKIFHIVAETWGIHVMYWYFSISCICCAIFVHCYVFETKGKTLKEIQDYLEDIEKINNPAFI